MIRRIGLAAVILTLGTALQFGVSAKEGRPRGSGRDQITKEIDEGQRVRLHGNTHPHAKPENDRGEVPDDFPLEHMLLQLRRPPELQQEFDLYVEGLTQGHSANFHQWLTPEQVGENYGLTESDLHRIERWLRRHGIRVNYVYPNRVVMDISATAEDLRGAMGVRVHFLEVDGEKHFANMNDPEIPEALASAIVGIVSIHDFRPHPMIQPLVHPTYADPSGHQLVTPPDLAAVYNLNPLFSQGITGANQTVVVVEDSDPFAMSDYTTFQTTFNLMPYGGTAVVTHPNPSGVSNCTDPGVNGDDSEVELDMEYATAAAPGAMINVATCANGATSGVLLAIQNVVASSPHPYIISVSYEQCEAANGAAGNAAFNSVYQTAVSEGISVFVASGDEGPADCDRAAADSHGINVSGLASTIYNVAVGGTDFGDTVTGTTAAYWSATNNSVLQSAKGYIREIPWDSSCASVLIATFVGQNPPFGATGYCNNGGTGFRTTSAGGGGPSGCATGAASIVKEVSGTCAGYAKPSYQSGLFGNPADGVRDLPDVSLFAANGVWGHFYVFCYTDPAPGRGGAPCTGTPNPAVAGGPWSGAGGTSFAAPILAAIQALVNQRTAALTITPVAGQGNPNPVYYAIAKSEYGVSGSAVCNSSTQPFPRRGVASGCVFYDLTQGDIDVNCITGTANCFNSDASADGAVSTGAISVAFTAGTGYTMAPTCTITAPHNTAAYNGGVGGSQATCMTTVSGGQVTGVTLTNAGAGYAPNPICTLTGGGGTGATCSASVTANSYQPAFPATPGWDFATGIGTINAYNLVYSTLWLEGP